MKNNKVQAVLHAIEEWHSQAKPITELCHFLGDEHNEVGQMLMLNGLADFAYKPMEGFVYQDVVNAVLLYLAMRQEIRSKAKPQFKWQHRP